MPEVNQGRSTTPADSIAASTFCHELPFPALRATSMLGLTEESTVNPSLANTLDIHGAT